MSHRRLPSGGDLAKVVLEVDFHVLDIRTTSKKSYNSFSEIRTAFFSFEKTLKFTKNDTARVLVSHF